MTAPKRSRPSEADEIEARAAAWIAQRDDGFSAEEADEFERWRTQDARHAAAVARLEKVWSALHELRDFRPDAHAHPDPDLLAPARRRSLVRFPLAGVIAAAAALFVVGLLWQRSTSGPARAGDLDSTQSFVTSSGGYQRISLSDGSVVELNANTEVRVHYTPSERRATLVSGEAHFTVASNPRRPFWVSAENVAVRAVGTAFDVRRDHVAVEVLVTAGRVQVDRDAVPIPLGGGMSALPAGWRARIATRSAAAPVIEKVERQSLRQELAWQSSRLVFVDTPLSEVIEEFNRHNDVQLVLGDPQLASLPIGGSFGAENVESFVRLISSNGDIRVERPSADQIVLRRGK